MVHIRIASFQQILYQKDCKNDHHSNRSSCSERERQTSRKRKRLKVLQNDRN